MPLPRPDQEMTVTVGNGTASDGERDEIGARLSTLSPLTAPEPYVTKPGEEQGGQDQRPLRQGWHGGGRYRGASTGPNS